METPAGGRPVVRVGRAPWVVAGVVLLVAAAILVDPDVGLGFQPAFLPTFFTLVIASDELIELDCDILIPAALGGVINLENAQKIKARMVVEAANSPVTPVAASILNDRGIHIVPDILANAGGVTVSYFEWVQNKQALRWSEDKVNARLEEYLLRAYSNVESASSQHSTSLRHGAFILAVKRVLEASKLRWMT